MGSHPEHEGRLRRSGSVDRHVRPLRQCPRGRGIELAQLLAQLTVLCRFFRLRDGQLDKERTRLVGLAGFEPTTSASRTQRSTKLSHSPSEGRGYPTPAETPDGLTLAGAPVGSS